MMQKFCSVCIAALFTVSASAVQAKDVRVVASIKPVHSLAAAIMRGIGTPELIVDGAGSPHAYSLKPSKARALAGSDLVIWVGPALETFLEKPLDALASQAKVLTLSQQPAIETLPLREGGAFEAHGHEEAGHETEGSGDHDDEFDMHLWLDPVNAKVIAKAIAMSLIDIDPERTARYQANLADLEVELDDLTSQVRAELEPVRARSFIVFHDAFRYFENRFGIAAAGSITINPEVAPGAERVREIRDRLVDEKVVCIFSEPQFAPKIVAAITDGTSVEHGELDPLGAALDNGPGLYPALIRQMAVSLKSCLSARM